jgi:hypothetical protein
VAQSQSGLGAAHHPGNLAADVVNDMMYQAIGAGLQAIVVLVFVVGYAEIRERLSSLEAKVDLLYRRLDK